MCGGRAGQSRRLSTRLSDRLLRLRLSPVRHVRPLQHHRRSAHDLACPVSSPFVLLTVILVNISFPSPTHSFTPGLNFPCLQILPTAAFPFILQD